jgi:hypothetical protein
MRYECHCPLIVLVLYLSFVVYAQDKGGSSSSAGAGSRARSGSESYSRRHHHSHQGSWGGGALDMTLTEQSEHVMSLTALSPDTGSPILVETITLLSDMRVGYDISNCKIALLSHRSPPSPPPPS